MSMENLGENGAVEEHALIRPGWRIIIDPQPLEEETRRGQRIK